MATARSDLQGTKDRILDGLNVQKERLEVLKVDVTGSFYCTSANIFALTSVDEESISTAAAHCNFRFKSTHLHLAFLLPGTLHPEKSPIQISAQYALETFRINTLGPLLLAKHFSAFLPKRSTRVPFFKDDEYALPTTAVLALMSARVGSISDNRLGGWYSYRASKSAVNSIAKSLDIYLQQKAADKAFCISMHPGTVKTDLSEEFWDKVQEEKLFSPEFAAEKLISVVKNLPVEKARGKCWDWEGKEIPP